MPVTRKDEIFSIERLNHTDGEKLIFNLNEIVAFYRATGASVISVWLSDGTVVPINHNIGAINNRFDGVVNTSHMAKLPLADATGDVWAIAENVLVIHRTVAGTNVKVRGHAWFETSNGFNVVSKKVFHPTANAE